VKDSNKPTTTSGSHRGTSFREHLNNELNDPTFSADFAEARERASIGLKIARMRTARGLSQSQLAERVNTTQSVISRYESADYDHFRVDTLRRLADALGADLTVDIHERSRR
jgi:ribosome-binding protein aMBF1 (putative translation factor)